MALSDLLDGLLTASFRGVEFDIPDVREEVGRRVQRFFFPGRDDTLHQDLGAFDGPINVTGVIVGDDYVQRAEALRAAFRTAGPGTLVHPWRGELLVVLAEPATITFSDREIRVARFDATFEPWIEAAPPQIDTLGGLLTELAALRGAMRAWLRQVLAPVRLALGVVRAIGGFATGTLALFQGTVLGLTNGGGLLATLRAPFAALGGIGALAADDTYADAVATGFDGVPATIATAALPPAAPAIGPGAAAASLPVLDQRETAAALLDATAAVPGLAGAVPAACGIAAEGFVLAAAIEAAARIPFESRQEALAWRARLDAAIVATATRAALAARTDPAGAGPVWQRLDALRGAVAADMRERAGRLPAVQTITPPAPVPVWLLANYLAGDDPARILPMAEDLVRRNGLRQPGAVPVRPLEYLA